MVQYNRHERSQGDVTSQGLSLEYLYTLYSGACLIQSPMAINFNTTV